MSAAHPVVLVHGAWHGAWCFAGLQHELDRRGVASYAVDLPGHGISTLPLGDMHGDAQQVAKVLTVVGRPAVLVGHSYGGAVVTQAAVLHPDVVHLVYLTAFALDDGESVVSWYATQPSIEMPLTAAVRPAGEGTTVLDPELVVPALYGDCEPEDVAAALPRLGPQPVASFRQPVTGSPRDRIPSTYVRCLRDQGIHVDHQTTLAARCSTMIDVECDHSPFLSRATETADLLTAIARS